MGDNGANVGPGPNTNEHQFQDGWIQLPEAAEDDKGCKTELAEAVCGSRS